MKYIYLSLTCIIIIMLGLIHLPLSFGGDQAFFLLGAKEIKEGWILYRDFWDIKQPAIFFFYLYAGKIFGFTEIGIHAFELCYWLIFSVVLVWLLKRLRLFRDVTFIYLTPILIVGSYYGFSSPSLLTQVEALVNFPLLLVLVFNYLFLTDKSKRIVWIILSGVAGGIVIFSKLIFAPILLALWVHLFIQYLKSHKKGGFPKSLFYFSLIPAGVVMLWLPFIIYCYKHEIFGICYEIFFKYPPLILQFGETRDYDALFISFKDFFFNILFIIPFTVASILLFKRKTYFITALWLWLIFAGIVIVLQQTSWFEYHFQMLYTPIMVLALFSLDYFLNRVELARLNLVTKSVRTLKFTIIMVISSFLMIAVVAKVFKLYNYNFAISKADRTEYILSRSSNKSAMDIAQYLIENDKSNCPIFCAADPLVYYYTNRNQATAQRGWCFHLFIPGQVDKLYRELQVKKPRFIFIHKSYEPFFNDQGLSILKWIHKNYMVGKTDKEGNWYKLNG